MTLALIAAFIGGIGIALQNPLASLMGGKMGPLESAFVIHAGGALFAGLPLLFLAGGRLSEWRTVPPLALVSGIFGLVLVATVSYAIPRVGIAGTLAAILTAQLTISAVLDHFGVFGVDVRAIDLQRLAGMAVLLFGTWLIAR